MNKILPIILIFCITILMSGQLYACDCDGEITVKESMKYSKIVFKGRVISTTITSDLSSYNVITTGDTTSDPFSYGLMKNAVAVYKVKVEKIYKGKSQSDTIVIITSTNVGSCGFVFDVERDYIIYADSEGVTLIPNKIRRTATDNKTYFTHLCTRTALYSKTEERKIKSIKG